MAGLARCVAVAMLATLFALAGQGVIAGSISYLYDAWGRVTSVTWANGQTTIYSYDAAGNRTATITGTVLVANPVSLTVPANSTANNVPISASGAYTSVAVPTAPAHGTATVSGITIKYAPTTGYGGSDAFTYTVSNATSTSAPAVVTVAVAPVAKNVSLTVAYDSAPTNVPLSIVGTYTTVAAATTPTHGTLTFPTATSIAYQPNTGYFGADGFTYTASNPAATSPAATAAITVNPQPPVANDFSATVVNGSVNNPMPLNITGGTPTSVAVAQQATHGTAHASGVSITYSSTAGYAGADSFTYTASNAGGTSSPATGHITVTGLLAIIPLPPGCTAPALCAGSATNTPNHTFSSMPMTCGVTGGSGNYTYAWNIAPHDTFGTWTSQPSGNTDVASVSGVKAGFAESSADYSCTVTDTSSNKTATSNAITYQWDNISPN